MWEKGWLGLVHYTWVNDLLLAIEVLYAKEICNGTEWKKAFPVSQENNMESEHMKTNSENLT